MAQINLRAYDHGRSDSISDMGSRWWKLMSELTVAAPVFASWIARDPDGTLTPVESEQDCRQALRRAGRYWKSGNKERIAYGPVAYATDKGIRTCEIAMVWGVEPLPVTAWVPNQTLVSIPPAARIATNDRERIELLFRAEAKVCDPAWAHVAIDERPGAPTPPFDNGAPVVGWLTYLSRAYPPVPLALPPPAVAYQIEGGTLLAAEPAKANSDSISALQKALGEAGVLLSARELRIRSGGLLG